MHLDASTGFGIDFCGTANVATDASIWKFKRLISFHSTLKASGGLEIPEILRPFKQFQCWKYQSLWRQAPR